MIKHGQTRAYIYTALEEMNFEWKWHEIETFLTLWLKGWSLLSICRQLDRDMDEAAVLIMDLSFRTNLLPLRKLGIQGQEPVVMEEAQSVNYSRIFKRFLRRNRVYVPFLNCDVTDFVWSQEELNVFRKNWNKGYSVSCLATILKRRELDVALLIIDQRKKDRIGLRKGGLWGWKDEIEKAG